jgi:hypothetical protein
MGLLIQPDRSLTPGSKFSASRPRRHAKDHPPNAEPVLKIFSPRQMAENILDNSEWAFLSNGRYAHPASSMSAAASAVKWLIVELPVES